MADDRTDTGRARVLIAGGGVAGLEAMLALRALADERVATTLVSPAEHFVYRPLAVGEPFALGEVRRYPLADLAAEHHAAFVHDALAAVDTSAHVATLESGAELPYDELVVALGARAETVFPQAALTYRDERDNAAFRALLAELREGVRSIAFLQPSGPSWPFPVYELALMTSEFAAEHGLDVTVTVVTPDDSPLALFGQRASDAIAELFAHRGIAVRAATYARPLEGGRVLLSPGDEELTADRFVALPRLVGHAIPGLPHDPDGFLVTSPEGRVLGVEHVYAAGDGTAFPVKQGGLAAQEADAAAEALAASLGARITPTPFKPVLRGMLLTGGGPRYLRAEIRGGLGDTSTIADHTLWWPPSKIAGRYLAPCLGAIDDATAVAHAAPHGVPIEVALEVQPPGKPGLRRRAIVPAPSEEEQVRRTLLEFPRGSHGK